MVLWRAIWAVGGCHKLMAAGLPEPRKGLVRAMNAFSTQNNGRATWKSESRPNRTGAADDASGSLPGLRQVLALPGFAVICSGIVNWEGVAAARLWSAGLINRTAQQVAHVEAGGHSAHIVLIETVLLHLEHTKHIAPLALGKLAAHPILLQL